MKFYLCPIVICLCLSIVSCAQVHHITYKESFADFSNPERGFYIPFGTSSAHFTPLNKEELALFQTQPQQTQSAEDVWEPETGYNKLNHILIIEP